MAQAELLVQTDNLLPTPQDLSLVALLETAFRKHADMDPK